jgi:alkylation response protein AidB-like acyl-CoA dehydrogenase
MGTKDLNQGEIFFDDARVPKEFMVCGPEHYEGMLDFTLAFANAAVAVIYLGAARAAFEEALRYAKDRVQGGRVLAGHQVIRAKLFDMFMSIEAGRSLSRRAIVYNQTNMPPSIEYSIAGKVFCTQTAFRCASEGVQIHGSNGLTQEYIMEKIFRDARTGMIADGANEILTQTAAEKLTESYDFQT